MEGYEESHGVGGCRYNSSALSFAAGNELKILDSESYE